jgi:hypothetical protein
MSSICFSRHAAHTKFVTLLAAGCASISAGADAAPADSASPQAPSPARTEQPLAVLLLDAGSYAEQCLKTEDLVSAVQAQVGSQTFVEAADPRASLTIRVAIQKIANPAGWQAQVRTQTRDGRVWGEREVAVEGEDCQALNEQLVLITSLMSDPSLVPSATPQEPVRSAVDEPRPKSSFDATEHGPDADDGAVSVAPRAPERHWQNGVEGALVGALGLLPGAAAGAMLRLRVGPPWFWTARASAIVYYPQEVEVLDGSARFGLALVGLDVCPVHGSIAEGMSASLCAGAHAGMLSVESFDLDDVRSVRRWVLEGFLAVGLTTPVGGGWYAGGELSLGIPTRRDTFAYTTAEGERVALFEQGGISVAFSALFGHTL